MIDTITADTAKQELTRQERTVSLFKFIEELNKLKQKVVLRVSEYPWWFPLADLPDDAENIHIYSCDRTEEEQQSADADPDGDANILLSVHRPELQPCPEPDAVFADWLEPNWDDCLYAVKTRPYVLHPLEGSPAPESLSEEERLRIDLENHTIKEFFEDDAARAQAFSAWMEQRTVWADAQYTLARTRRLFADLYKISVDLERESETLELVCADGFLRDRVNPQIEHPILTRRVKIRHDAVENVIYIEDTDVETQLYTVIFQNMTEINLASINHMQDELRQNDYHPLDRCETPDFFKSFVHQLSSESLYSEDGIPAGWQQDERLLLYRRPCLILRRRMDGALKAIEQIVEHVEQTGQVPAPIVDIVEGGKIDVPEDTGETPIEEQLAAVGGESVEILLSKEANKEQLEIARRIERYNAVLVQGPPGTGKTHTIANLMGHFLAQGKSVLVTSQTQKALSVLKEKVAPGLQNLCVSMLDDSNLDMEKSIDGITSCMSRCTSFEMKREMDAAGRERAQIIEELAQVRKKLYAIIHQECDCIVVNGESISPSAAAAYVQENSETLSYIPGTVRLYAPLPLTFAQLSELYQSNGKISTQEEQEFERDLPDPAQVMTPAGLEQNQARLGSCQARLDAISQENNWTITLSAAENTMGIEAPFGQLTLTDPAFAAAQELGQYAADFPHVETWMQYCAVDGKKGDSYRQLWLTLIRQIQDTRAFAENLTTEKFGKDVRILTQSPDFADAMQQLMSKYSQGGRIGKLALLFNKQLEIALNGATINGQKPQNAADCALVLHVMEMKSLRDQCACYWNDLMASHGLPGFYDLDAAEPERIAANYIPVIQRYLDWFKNEYETLLSHMEAAGLPCDLLFRRSMLDSEIVSTEKTLTALGRDIPLLCEVFSIVETMRDTNRALTENLALLQAGKRVCSDVCRAMAAAAQDFDLPAYRDAYAALESTYAKTALKRRREEYLSQISAVAPQWAAAIRGREGVHGQPAVPSDIDDAWKWKQYCGIVAEITAAPFAELQQQSLALSRQYRESTALYAEKSAWYHLLCKTEHDISMKQALVGWKQTVRKIGKGTGKNAPMYRAKARELMTQCQCAVPGWIMPIGKALESLNPRTNKFDIIIIDEASQSDISSLAILYMGRKLVIVGDDKQVSPMAVGLQSDRMNTLKEMYIAGKIPNAHLYDAKTSIYDIAATTFQPLMLREHFRCVPEIIGFSNWLSYDFKIKPLRDSSNSLLLPAVVNYRAENGERVGKTNPGEAKSIVALMQACMQQPEYEGKTFGVISMLGDEQVKKLQEEIYRSIDTKTCAERRILCGNASNFQGDERDVIFLSLVDCANGEGPVAKQGFGVDDAYRKRYNVAASRARDQLWVVDSLDPANDLKPGDIRKMLIDYSISPEAVHAEQEKICQQAESPFEVAVAQYLTVRGYHLVQQWKVGAYRLDMVAVCGQKKIAIECDGERYHSGEEKIREDMERQTILERLGWQFIRIRGSEYYRDPEKAMARVIGQLEQAGIAPEAGDGPAMPTGRDTELLRRIKQEAYRILHPEPKTNPAPWQ